MATSKEVFALRKEGNLDEAYKMALILNEAPHPDEWDVRALGWCLIDLIKRDVRNGNRDSLSTYQRCLEKIVVNETEDSVLAQQKVYALSLCDPEAPIVLKAHALSKEGNYADAIRAYRSLKQIPESARISYGWDLYRHARQLLEHATLDVARIKQLIMTYLGLNLERPSKLHSAFLLIAKKLAKDNKLHMGKFLVAWGMDNFQREDYVRHSKDGGGVFPSLVEDALHAGIKSSLASNDKEKIAYLVPYLDNIIGRFPDNEWLVYYMAKALVALGREKDALEYCIGICKRKPNDFWAWQLLGEAYAADPNISLACYAKGLLCPADEQMTVKLRANMAQLLADLGYYEAAKYEVVKYSQLKSDIPSKIIDLMSQPWFNETALPASNNQFYAGLAGTAEDILTEDLPWLDAVVGPVYKHHREGKADQTRRKIYVKKSDEDMEEWKIGMPYETFYPENKFPIKNAVEGTPISIKGEALYDSAFKVVKISARAGEPWDIFKVYRGVINFVNSEKQVYHVIIHPRVETFFHFHISSKSFHIGDFVELSIARLRSNRYNIVRVMKTSISPDPSIYKKFCCEEIVSISGECAFTKSGIFLPPPLLKNYNVEIGYIIEGAAVLNFNKRRSEWSWKAIEITDCHPNFPDY